MFSPFTDRRLLRSLVRGSGGSPIIAGPPVRLQILVQPSSTATSGIAIAQQPIVVAVDAQGLLVSIAGRTITATPDQGGIAGAVALTDSVGFATYAGLTLAAIGGQVQTTRTLTFSSAGLISAVATSILVSDPGATDIDALVGIGNCEVLIDSIAGVVGDGVNITGITDLSGKTRTISMPDGVIPFTAVKWNGNQPGWSFNAATKHRMQVSGGNPVYPIGGFYPFSVVSLMDGWTNAANQGNLYRDAAGVSVAFMELNGVWAMFDGATFDSNFNAANEPGKVIHMAVHNAPNSIIVATDSEQVGDTGAGFRNLHAYFIGSNSANTSPVTVAAQAMHIMYSKALSLADRDLIRTILKRRYGGIVTPTLGHGPILSTNSVIDGTTVLVQNSTPFAGSNFVSTELYQHTIVLRFSSPLRQFAMSILSTEYDSVIGVTNGAAFYCCDDYIPGQGMIGIHSGYGFQYAGNHPGERGFGRYDPGFSTVVIKNVLINQATFGFLFSVWTDAHFWLVGEPLTQ